MSTFEDAVTWMQNDKTQLLFYLIEAREIEPTVSSIDLGIHETVEWFDFRSESEYPVALFEWTSVGVYSEKRVRELIDKVLEAFEPSSFAAFCMFEGVYADFKEMLDPRCLAQTYATQIGGTKSVSIEDSARHSEAWRGKVSDLFERIIARYSPDSSSRS